MDARLQFWFCSSPACLWAADNCFTIPWSLVCMGNLWKFLWMRNRSKVLTIKKTLLGRCYWTAHWNRSFTLKKKHKQPKKPTNWNQRNLPFLWNVTTEETNVIAWWNCWALTNDFCHSRITSLLQTHMMCWLVLGAAPMCWTKWSMPSSAGSYRSKSNANLSLTVMLCWVNCVSVN